MNSIPWYEAILISIPQTFLIMALGFGLFNVKIGVKKSLLIAAAFGIVCYYLKELPISNDLNALILVLLLTLATRFVFLVRIAYCFISVLLGLLVYAVLESLLVPVFLMTTHLSLDSVLKSPFLNIVAFLPIFLVTCIILWLFKRYKIIIFDLSDRVVGNVKS